MPDQLAMPIVRVEHDRPYEAAFGPHWYVARCPNCNKPLSRYDDNPEDCAAFGQNALDSGEHRCG